MILYVLKRSTGDLTERINETLQIFGEFQTLSLELQKHLTEIGIKGFFLNEIHLVLVQLS